MKRYPSRDDFRRNIVVSDEKGFRQRLIDGYRVQVLQACRVAAAFVVAILSTAEITDEKLRQCMRELIVECEEVLNDDSVYVIIGRSNSSFSRQLAEAVKKADLAISHAGNFCNNMVPVIVPEKIHKVILRARDICEDATKWKRYSP